MKTIHINKTKILLLFALCLWPFAPGIAQSAGQNYIVTQIYTSATAHNDVIQYYDGLGRPVETVRKQFTPGSNPKDLVSRIEYDNFGRESKAWLPVPTNKNDGSYNGPYGATTTYNNDNYAYSEIKYEPSPLSRVDEQYGPGAAWRGSSNRRVKTEHMTNTSSTSNPALACARYHMESPYSFKKNSYYDAGQLYVTKTTDEDNNIAYEFKDKLGHVLLHRQMDGSDRYDTYYIYDDFGNLCVVSPPLSSDTIVNDGQLYGSYDSPGSLYQYHYIYDHRNRPIFRKVAGTHHDYVFDGADRQVIYKTPENEDLFTKYDALGRVILSGIYTGNNKDIYWLRNHFLNLVSKEERKNNPDSCYYTWNTFPSANEAEVTQVNFYDDYGYISSLDNNLGYVAKTGYDAQYPSAKGLLTGTRVKLLGASGWINTAYYYDYKGNLVQKRSSNQLGGYDKEYYAYNYNNLVTKKYIEHNSSTQSAISEEYVYSYDSQMRLTGVTHNLNGEGAVIIAAYTYDNLGRKRTETTGNLSATETTYAYNIRSWETSGKNSKFEENLYYTSSPKTGGQVYFGGNIAALTWKDPIANVVRGYAFRYDRLSRLKDAGYGEGISLNTNTQWYSESFTYDKQGNPLTIGRYGRKDNGAFDLIDSLAMPAYTGNFLREVTDAAGDQNSADLMEFKNGINNPEEEYIYWCSGAVMSDYNKKICMFKYNYLLLPQSVQFRYGHRIEYTYDAAGMKRTVKYREANHNMNYSPWDTREPAESDFLSSPLTKNYTGNKVYENGNLKLILTDNGYIEKSGTSYNRYYYLKDRIGNIRVVLNSSGNPVQITNYYPSGTTMAEATARTDQGVQPYKFGGKELDRSKGLDFFDYEWRQFDPTLMRFTTPDPLAEKYYAISPYAYCGNNPVNAIDPSGRDIIVLNAPTGAYGKGHSAVLIGNNRDGWTYISKDGSKWLPMNGPSKYTNSNENLKKPTYSSEEDFNNSAYALNYGYTQRVKFSTSAEQDKKAISAADKASKRWYSILFSNCVDAVSEALIAAGLNPGYTWFGLDNSYADPTTDKTPIPNDRFKKIAKNNNGDIYNVAIPIREDKSENRNTSWNNFWNTLNSWLSANPNIVVNYY